MMHRQVFSRPRPALDAIAGLLIVAAIGGCATGPAIKPFETVSAITIEVHAPTQLALEVPVGAAVGKAARSAAGEAAAEGALAGFECGPFFVICSPVAALVGASMGAIVGGAEEAASTLPDDQAATLNVVAHLALSDFDPSAALARAAENAARAHGIDIAAPSDESAARLTLELGRVEWVIGSGNTVRPRATMYAIVDWSGGIVAHQFQRDGARSKATDLNAGVGEPIPTLVMHLFDDTADEVLTAFGAILPPERSR